MERIFIFLLLLVPAFVQAESTIYIDEDDEIISEKGPSEPSGSKILILNNQKVDQKTSSVQNPQISNQPVVRVNGVPVSNSHATELQKSRRDAEIQTEQKIVERLERSRLKDEQERLDKILKPYKEKSVVVVNNDGNLYSEKTTVSQPEVENDDEIFVGLHIGQASNLTNRIEESYGSFGISAGSYNESGLMLEGAVFYSEHEVSKDSFNMYYNTVYDRHLSPFSNVDQFTGALSLKYTPFSRKFRPYIGVSVFYNMWMYDNDDEIFDLYSFCPYRTNSLRNRGNCNSSRKTTDSIDLGAHVGLDVKINKKISLGFNLLINIANLYNNNVDVFSRYQLHYDNLYYDFHNPDLGVVNLEETNWVIASINAKMYF